MNNNIANSAVEAVNKMNMDKAVAKASCLVSQIVGKQEQLKAAEGRVACYVKGINDLQTDILDASKLGITVADNINGQTVAATIATLNKSKQDSVKQASERLGLAIDGEQKNITLLNTQIAELQKALGEITPEVVTTTDIVG